MKGDSEIIRHLNQTLRNELTAINQYFLHSRMLRDWGLTKLSEQEYNGSIEEMKHADLLVERILFLEGQPNMQEIDKLLIGENTREMLECDLKLEYQACKDLKEAISCCEQKNDHVSLDLFKKILTEEEEHIEWLETQVSLIDRIGLENYQQSMAGS